jgi:hypothetical protein
MPSNMHQQPTWIEQEQEAEETANRQTASLAGVVITLVLLVIGVFLVRELHAKAAIEDCLLAGRSNCDWLVQAQF